MLLETTVHRVADGQISKVPSLTVSTADAALNRIRRALRSSAYGDLRSVRVSRLGDTIRLEGRVCSFYMKQLAQVLALNVRGVGRIDNGIDVA